MGGPKPYDRTTYEREFWKKVDKAGPIVRPDLGQCWLWTGAHNPFGHGRVASPRSSTQRTVKMRPAAQIVIEITTGEPFPVGMEACHHCDNPPCVNPTHIFIGTHRDNLRDAMAKGRLKPRLRQERCMRGHSMADAYVDREGDRHCRPCQAMRARVRMARLRAEAAA